MTEYKKLCSAVVVFGFFVFGFGIFLLLILHAELLLRELCRFIIKARGHCVENS